MSELNDDDQICIETCDKHGDQVDLFPMYVDIITNVKLTIDTVINEVRFCQIPNKKPDTRDKTELVDRVISTLMQNYYHGDQTVMDELLKQLPWNILKHSLPEPMWKEFEEPTQLNTVLDGSSCISTPAVMNLVKNYNVNPIFLYTGLGEMFKF